MPRHIPWWHEYASDKWLEDQIKRRQKGRKTAQPGFTLDELVTEALRRKARSHNLPQRKGSKP